jgi:hypothetical protein
MSFPNHSTEIIPILTTEDKTPLPVLHQSLGRKPKLYTTKKPLLSNSNLRLMGVFQYNGNARIQQKHLTAVDTESTVSRVRQHLDGKTTIPLPKWPYS